MRQDKLFRHLGSQHYRRVSKNIPGICHLFSTTAVSINHRGHTMHGYSTDCMTSAVLCIFGKKRIHFILPLHRWSPGLKNRREQTSNTTRWQIAIPFCCSDPCIAKTRTSSKIILEIPYTTSHSDQERVAPIILKFINCTCTEVTRRKRSMTSVTSIIQQGHSIIYMVDQRLDRWSSIQI